jgi:nitrite reductase/ring-hydroxylating ferredoxin subunit
MKPNKIDGLPRPVQPGSARNSFDDQSDLANCQPQVSRRTFCSELLLSSTVLVVGTTSIAGETATAQESLLAYPPTKIEGAEKLIIGGSLYFEYPTHNDPAVLLRSSEGQYSAFSRKCSHAGCSVEFDRSGRCLKCPCHRGMFDARMGQVMYGPPQRPLDQIVLQVRAGGEVWAVGKRIGNNGDKFAEGFRTSGSRSSD